jgi:hypothetical protein
MKPDSPAALTDVVTLQELRCVPCSFVAIHLCSSLFITWFCFLHTCRTQLGVVAVGHFGAASSGSQTIVRPTTLGPIRSAQLSEALSRIRELSKHHAIPTELTHALLNRSVS